MEAFVRSLSGEISLTAMSGHVAVQLVFWSAFTELGLPLVRMALSLLPHWSNFKGNEVAPGRPVWSHAPSSLALALWRAAGALAACAGHFGGILELFRLGLAIETAYHLSDFVMGSLGVRRYNGGRQSWQVRGMLMLYNVFCIALALKAAVTYAERWDIQRLAVYLIGSGASLAAVVPLQYVANPTTPFGSRVAFAMQLVNFLFFAWCRLLVGVYGKSSLVARVLTYLYASDPVHAFFMAAAMVHICYVFGAITIVLLWQRLRQMYQFQKSKVKILHRYFQTSKITNPKDQHDHIWDGQKLYKLLVFAPVDMMSAGPWCGMRKKLAP